MTPVEVVAIVIGASVLVGLGWSLFSEYRARRKVAAVPAASIVEAPGGERFIEHPTGASVGLFFAAIIFNVYELARIMVATEVLVEIAQALIWIGGNLVIGFLLNLSRRRAFVLHKRETSLSAANAVTDQ